ncbi:MAG: thioredoxin family protein [Saprospiraceae bacterium]
MRNRLLLIFMLTAPFLMSISHANTKVDFFRGNLNVAKDRAATEGKLYFIDFTASWCMPCRWMDETTFNDPALAQYVKNNYIAVKVDIDDFDGFALKQIHNIKMLPSILVFNSQGKEVARYEESLSATRMMQILKTHNTAANRKKTKIAAPAPPKPSAPISRPPLGSTKPSTPKPPVVSAPQPAPTQAVKPVIAGDGLYRFSVQRQPSEGYSIQIGAFAEYGNVLTEAARLEKLFSKPIIVHIAKLGDRTVYKVLIGQFDDRANAIEFLGTVKSKGIEAIIKDLSVMG